MQRRNSRSLVYAGCALTLMIGLGACTKGGQFDPTELVSGDMFEHEEKNSGRARAALPARRTRRGNRRTAGSGEGLPAAAGTARGHGGCDRQRPKLPRRNPNQKQSQNRKVARAPAPVHRPPIPHLTRSLFRRSLRRSGRCNRRGRIRRPQRPPRPTGRRRHPAGQAQQAAPAATAQTNWPAPPQPQAQTNWPNPTALGQPH